MKTLTLVRTSTSDQGTLGVLGIDGELFCRTIELPWRDNQRCRSCIPEGEYLVTPVISPRFGPSLSVRDVPDRSHILFHAGNWAGDVELGLRSNSKGCILVGQYHGSLLSQSAVLASKVSERRLLGSVRETAYMVVGGTG